MVYRSGVSGGSYSAKSGDTAFRLAGQRTAGANALYRYKIADTRIKVQAGMKLSYWQRAENSLGLNVTVDLMLDDGNYLTGIPEYNLQGETALNVWQQKTVQLPASLVTGSRYITAVIIGYRDNSSITGNFAALIDDIIIDK
jgi:hypothetical protein